ncbi:MAG: hypothetical protein FWF45_06350 [Coriobacteriia bacterium]|nr:hypothetical protein [Coriobacteriia bacterium]
MDFRLDLDVLAKTKTALVQVVDELKNLATTFFNTNASLTAKGWKGLSARSFDTVNSEWQTTFLAGVTNVSNLQQILTSVLRQGTDANSQALSLARSIGGSSSRSSKKVLGLSRSDKDAACKTDVKLVNGYDSALNLYRSIQSDLSSLRYTKFSMASEIGSARSGAQTKQAQLTNLTRGLNNYGNTINQIEQGMKSGIANLKQPKGWSGALAQIGSDPALKLKLANLGFGAELGLIIPVVWDLVNFGAYGGDQNGPYDVYNNQKSNPAAWASLLAVIRQYHPNWTDQQIGDFLQKLNNEGCGYVALVNTIFVQYKNNPAGFERAFGFPLYVLDPLSGEYNLNYNALLLDFYCATDNHNKGFFGGDTVNPHEDSNAIKGFGVTATQLQYRAETYLQNRGVKVTVTTAVIPEAKVDVSSAMYHSLSKNGSQVILSMHPPKLYHMDGSYDKGNSGSGGHDVVVTGTTKDGDLVVSSWGQQYLVKPNDFKSSGFDYAYFQVVTYGNK